MSKVPYADESVEAYYARMEGIRLPVPSAVKDPMIALNWEFLDRIKKNRDAKRN